MQVPMRELSCEYTLADLPAALTAYVGHSSGSDRKERISPKWGMAALAVVAFFAGPRTTYMVFEMASAVMGWAVMTRIIPAYWAAPS